MASSLGQKVHIAVPGSGGSVNTFTGALLPYQSVATFTLNLPTAGSAVQVSGTTVPCKLVVISCPIANTSQIYVGDSSVASTRGVEILPGSSKAFPVDNLTDLYVVGVTNNDDAMGVYYN